jgi:hypothetical protein
MNKRAIVLCLIIIMIMLPVVFSQGATPTQVWNPRDDICEIYNPTTPQYGSFIVPSCDTQWTLTNFVPAGEQCPVCQICQPCPSSNSNCPVCPTINAQSCQSFCPKFPSSNGAPATSQNTSGTGWVAQNMGGSPFLDIIFIGLILGVLALAVLYKKEQTKRVQAEDAYAGTYQRFTELSKKYTDLVRLKNLLSMPSSSVGDQKNKR